MTKSVPLIVAIHTLTLTRDQYVGFMLWNTQEGWDYGATTSNVNPVGNDVHAEIFYRGRGTINIQATYVARPPIPLESLKIKFSTTEDDKDSNMTIDSTFEASGQVLAEWHMYRFNTAPGTDPRPGSSGPKAFPNKDVSIFEMALSRPVSSSETEGSVLKFYITPHGGIIGSRDRWVFDCSLLYKW